MATKVVGTVIIDKLLVEGKDLKIKREPKEAWDIISWYNAPRKCLDCEGDIEFIAFAYGQVCDSC